MPKQNKYNKLQKISAFFAKKISANMDYLQFYYSIYARQNSHTS